MFFLHHAEAANEAAEDAEAANEAAEEIDMTKTAADDNDGVNETSESSFRASDAEPSSEDEQPVLKPKKKAAVSSSEPRRVRQNLHIPPSYLGAWLDAKNRNDAKPVIRKSGKYMYGVGVALDLAGISWSQFGILYVWVKNNVRLQSWMRQLRKAGVGDEMKGAARLQKRNLRVANIFRGWCKTHNKYNDGKKVTCNKDVQLLDCTGWRVRVRVSMGVSIVRVSMRVSMGVSIGCFK